MPASQAGRRRFESGRPLSGTPSPAVASGPAGALVSSRTSRAATFPLTEGPERPSLVGDPGGRGDEDPQLLGMSFGRELRATFYQVSIQMRSPWTSSASAGESSSGMPSRPPCPRRVRMYHHPVAAALADASTTTGMRIPGLALQLRSAGEPEDAMRRKAQHKKPAEPSCRVRGHLARVALPPTP